MYKVCVLTYFFSYWFYKQQNNRNIFTQNPHISKPESFSLFGIKPQTHDSVITARFQYRNGYSHHRYTKSGRYSEKSVVFSSLGSKSLSIRGVNILYYPTVTDGNPDVWVMAPLQVINYPKSFKDLQDRNQIVKWFFLLLILWFWQLHEKKYKWIWSWWVFGCVMVDLCSHTSLCASSPHLIASGNLSL